MNTKYKPLYPFYKAYYEQMAKHYYSENEKLFFETMRYRQQYEFTYANDLLLFEADNEDGLYIVRHYYDEFEIGRVGIKEDFYAMDLPSAMQVNLKKVGLLGRDITLLEWLRERDYQGINYNGNFDNL